MTSLKGRDYIEMQDLTTGEINELLNLAKELRARFLCGKLRRHAGRWYRGG